MLQDIRLIFWSRNV